MSAREHPMTPATQPANGELPRNVRTGNVLTVEPNRPRRVRMGEVGDWKLDLLIRDFARFINSEVALLCQGGGRGQPPAVVSSWGLGATREEVARPRGGLVGRAPPLARAALEPLHPLLDSSLVYATHPPLRYAAAVGGREQLLGWRAGSPLRDSERCFRGVDAARYARAYASRRWYVES